MGSFMHQVDEARLQSLQLRLEEMSLLSADFMVFISGSTVIATFGLFQNSPAVIIGAMIIAPLMRPILGLSLATLTGDVKLLFRAIVSIATGIVTAICISGGLAFIFRSLELTSEITGRTHPTLLDLGVAVAAGAVGAYCHTDEKLADTLAGVAIAVALVPPLSVVGIGLAFGQSEVYSGAMLLFLTNLVGITVAGALVFLIKGYIPLKQARRGLIVSAFVSLLLIVPLGLSMKELILENQISGSVKQILREKTFTFKGVQLHGVRVERFKKMMTVTATVTSPEQPITNKQVALVESFLSTELNLPLKFRIQMIPSTQITSEEPPAILEASPGSASNRPESPKSESPNSESSRLEQSQNSSEENSSGKDSSTASRDGDLGGKGESHETNNEENSAAPESEQR